MSTKVLSITSKTYASFVAEKEYAVIHFDASWDVGHRPLLRMIMAGTALAFPEGVNFGEIDCDVDGNLAKTIPIGAVPAVAYYRAGHLVAVLIGSGQNVLERLHRLMRNEPLGYNDGSDLAPGIAINKAELEIEREIARDADWRRIHSRGTANA